MIFFFGKSFLRLHLSRNNMMFPAVNEDGVDGFTEQQLEHIRKNLRVYPH